MKHPKLIKSWKFVNKWIIASSLLATSVVAPLTISQCRNKNHKDVPSKKQSKNVANIGATNKNITAVNNSPGNDLTQITGKQLFNDDDLASNLIAVTAASTSTENVYNLSIDTNLSYIDASEKTLYMANQIVVGTDTYKITSIGTKAFSSETYLLSCKCLVFPENLTSIGDNAFYGCDEIESLDFSNCNNLSSIGGWAFWGCSKLTSLDLKTGCTKLESIGIYAFFVCMKLSDVSLPDSLTSIGENAFGYCPLEKISTPNEESTGTGMKTWTWGAGSTLFTSRAFYGSNSQMIGLIVEQNTEYKPIANLAAGQIDLSNSELATIEAYRFVDCSGITNIISWPSNLTTIGEYAFGNSNITSLTLPNGLTTIGPNAFTHDDKLTSVSLPNTLTTIDSMSFYLCNNITSVDLTRCESSTVSSWSSNIFSNFYSIEWYIPYTTDDSELSTWNAAINTIYGAVPTYVGFIRDASNYITGDSVSGDVDVILSNAQSASSALTITNGKNLQASNCAIIDSANITKIGEYAFSYNTNLIGSLTLSNTITKIETNAFNGCNKLTSISLSNELNYIGDSAFSGCNGLTSLILPNKLETIGTAAFYNDSGLSETLTIPNSVSYIGTNAFYGCENISAINLANFSTIPTNWQNECFNQLSADFIIPAITDTTVLGRWYSSINSWTSNSSDNVYINDNAKNWATGVTAGTFQLKVSDDTGALRLIKSTNVQANNLTFNGTTITAIDEGVFQNNTNLTGALNLSSAITSIGNNAFDGCNMLTSITLPNGSVNIGSGAFSKCSRISSIDLSNCDPDTIPSWANGIFSDFSNGAKWFIPYTTNTNKLTNWYKAIKNWTSIDTPTVIIQGPATDWGKNISNGDCRIQLNDSTGSSFTLLDGSSIVAKNLVLNNNITVIGDEAFKGDTNLTGSLTIPSSVSDIGTNAFGGCTKISTIDLTNFSTIPTNWQDGCLSGLNAKFLIPTSTNPSTLGAWYTAISNWISTTPNVQIEASAKNYAEGVTAGTFSLKVDDSEGDLTLVDGTDVVATNLIINRDSGIRTIGDGAFQSNRNLSGSIEISSNITTIGANALNGCSYLNQIRLDWRDLSSANLLIDKDWLGGDSSTSLNNANTTILVPNGMVEAYQAVATAWGMDQCTITDGTTPPSPTPTDNTNTLPIYLGMGLGLGIPLIGVIIGLIAQSAKINKLNKKPKKSNSKKKK